MAADTPAGGLNVQAASKADNDLITAAYNHMHHALPRATQLYFDAESKPVAGSRLAKAKQDADLYGGHSLAGILFQASEDHLHLVVESFPLLPIARYALYTAIRGAIEAAGWSLWLENADASEKVLVARCLTERVVSIRELNKLGRAANYAKQIKQMLTVATRFGITPIAASKADPDPIAFDERRPTVTKLLSGLLPAVTAQTNNLSLGEHTYKTLSARAHATGWALVEGAVPVNKVTTHATMQYITASIPEIHRVLGIARELHLRCVENRLALAGRKPEELTTALAGMPTFTP